MGLRINNSSEAANAQRSLNSVNKRLSAAMERVASGSRINTAADDPSGLGLSERMRAELSSIDQSQRSVYDGIGATQVADGAASQMQEILQRVRDLAVQYNNGTNDAQAQEAITTEVGQLNGELEHIVDSTKVNGKQVLNVPGHGPVITIQIGLQDFGEIPIRGLDGPSALGTAVSEFAAMGSGGGTIDIEKIDKALEHVSEFRSDMGATQNRLEKSAESLDVYRENLAASESQIRDADMAQAITQTVTEQIRQQTSMAMLAQANMSNANVLNLLHASG